MIKYETEVVWFSFKSSSFNDKWQWQIEVRLIGKRALLAAQSKRVCSTCSVLKQRQCQKIVKSHFLLLSATSSSYYVPHSSAATDLGRHLKWCRKAIVSEYSNNYMAPDDLYLKEDDRPLSCTDHESLSVSCDFDCQMSLMEAHSLGIPIHCWHFFLLNLCSKFFLVI